jgi:hypothetical protein
MLQRIARNDLTRGISRISGSLTAWSLAAKG